MGYPTDEDFRQAHREGWPPGTLMGEPKKKARKMKPKRIAMKPSCDGCTGLCMERCVKNMNDKSYFAPGAVWGTIAGTVTVIGRSRDKKRPFFTECLIHETGQRVDLHLTERHSSPSLPGYTGMYTRLPRNLWPKKRKK